MKLGTDTGSVINHLMSGTNGAPEPVVGMGATILCWTDRHACTIVKVTPRTIHVKRDISRRLDDNGMSEIQRYAYESDPLASTEIFRLTKNGWRKSGGGPSLMVGTRREYHDYSF